MSKGLGSIAERTMEKKALAEIHLKEANAHIARSEALVKQQEERLQRLNEQGKDLTEALDFLILLNGRLMTMYEHRALILRELKE